MNWQLIVVLVLVSAAVYYLAHSAGDPGVEPARDAAATASAISPRKKARG